MERQALKDYLLNKYGLTFQKSAADPLNLQIVEVTAHNPFIVLSVSTPQLDVKCPNFAATIQNLQGFTEPQLMNYPEWVGIQLNQIKAQDLFNVLDYAFKSATNGNQNFIAQQLVYLPSDDTDSKYQSQLIPQRQQLAQKHRLPEQLEKMMASYDYTILPMNEQGENFYRQGQMVANYEDDYDQIYELRRYYPDYHAMNGHQLRTYFTWRTQLRKGNFTVSSTSYAYVYIYELLNNIGVKDPNDGFQKLLEFDQKYAASYGQRMKDYLHQWMQDYVLYYGLERTKANQVFADQLKVDHEYHILRHPEDYSVTKVMDIFLEHSPYLKKCRLYKTSPAKWTEVVVMVWQFALQKNPQIFTNLIANQTLSAKYFFAGAVFAFHRQPRLTEYPIDSERTYQFKDRKYYCNAWYPLKDQQKRLNTFFHELDRLARQQFHLGHPLKPRQLDSQILQLVSSGLEEYQKQEVLARQPKIELNLSSLDQIRSDASATRDSLLTDEEKQADDELIPDPSSVNQVEDSSAVSDDAVNDILNINERYLVHALLDQKPYQDYLKKHHLMVSILVDSINEKLFDEIGDSVIEFNDQDEPEVIDDYKDDLRELLKEDDA